MKSKTALNLVFERAGGQSALAKRLNLTRQAVSAWPHVPLKHLQDVAEITGLSRDEIRPDLAALFRETAA